MAYMFDTFPALSTTFLQREVEALSRLGLTPLLVSHRRPRAGAYQPGDEKLLERTFYLRPINPWRLIMANLRISAQCPRSYLKGLKLALDLASGYPWQRIRNLGRLALTAILADYFVQKKVKHVHVHFAFGAADLAIWLEAISGLPYSLSVHGSDVLEPMPLLEEKLRRARFIVSNCAFHVTDLRRRFPSLHRQRFHLVNLGLDLRSEFWSRTDPELSCPPLRILNVARLHPVKNQEVLIRACAHLEALGVKFLCRIVGDGPERSRLKSLIARMNLTSSVELMGARYEPEVASLFDWAHVMALSSRSEGTPVTVIEAMTKGRPVVAPLITALPEMVVDGQTGFLCEPQSAEDLARKLARFAENPELIRKMGLAGRKRAEKIFNIQENTRKLQSIFVEEMPFLSRENGKDAPWR